MADYRSVDPDGTRVTQRSGAGRTIGIVVAALVVLGIILFATGFWSADVKEGSLPDVDISAKGGSLPSVDLDSKEVVVGTTDTTIEVPKLTTEKEKIEVPVVGVRDNGGK